MQYTISQITAEIASRLGKELDEPFKRMLGSKVDGWRATLIRRTLQNHPNERAHFLQKLFVPLEKTNPVPECLDPNAPTCYIMRSTLRIPVSVRANGILYDYVGSVAGDNAFNRVIAGTAYVMSKSKYTGKKPGYDLTNSYLDVYNALGMPLALVIGIFEKPSDVSEFNCASSGQGCDYWNEPYPVSGDIKQAIVESILKVDFAPPQVPANKEIEVTPQTQEHAPDGR